MPTPIQTQQATATTTQTPAPEVRAWWQDAVFYEIFVRSFYDSNGDGIGDINGIIQKLDYLQRLGVTALWLMPIYPSPSYHGYDVTDYFNVNPQYDTLDDLKNLLDQAHQRGMHVILDMVLNHTSNKNPWFVNSDNNVAPYRDWYIWSADNPGYMGPIGTAWFPGKQGFYYGIFGAGMPDLNYTNPAVTAEMEKVITFWLKNVGVDGFRMDAINYLVEEGKKQVNTQSTHAWLKGFYAAYKADNPQAFAIGEVFGADAALASTYTGDQLDMAFNFELASGLISSANGGSNSAIDSALSFSKQSLPTWQFGTFLTNHDQNRTMDSVYGNLDKAKLAAFLLLTSPGTTFIYYGEEIGMEGSKPDPQIRRPMQWTAGANSGFTSAAPWEPVGPDYQIYNVSSEESDPSSLLSLYRNLIALRKQTPLLRSGDLSLIDTNSPGVYAVLRSRGSDSILVLANLTKSPIHDYSLTAKSINLANGLHALTPLFGSAQPDSMLVQNGSITGYKPLSELPAYGTYVFTIAP